MQMNQGEEEDDDEQQQQYGDEIMSQFSDASISRTFISRLYAQVGRGQLPSEAKAEASPSFEEPSLQTRPPTPEEPQQRQQQEVKKENAMAAGDNDEEGEEEEDDPQQMPPAVQQEEERIAMDDSGDDNREFKEEKISLGDTHPASIRIEVKRSQQQQRNAGLGLSGLQGQLPVESQDLKDDPPPVNYVEFARRMMNQQSASSAAAANRRRVNGGDPLPPPANGNGGGGAPPPLPPAEHLPPNEVAYLALTDMSRAWMRFVTLLASHFGITEADVVEPRSSFEFKDASDFDKVWFMRLRTKFNGLCTQALEEVSRATGVSQKKNCSRLVLKCPEDFVALVLLIDTDINVLKGAIWVKQTTRVDSARTRISLLQNIAKSLGLRVRLREWC